VKNEKSKDCKKRIFKNPKAPYNIWQKSTSWTLIDDFETQLAYTSEERREKNCT
jgi:hypothetical protein